MIKQRWEQKLRFQLTFLFYKISGFMYQKSLLEEWSPRSELFLKNRLLGKGLEWRQKVFYCRVPCVKNVWFCTWSFLQVTHFQTNFKMKSEDVIRDIVKQNKRNKETSIKMLNRMKRTSKRAKTPKLNREIKLWWRKQSDSSQLCIFLKVAFFTQNKRWGEVLELLKDCLKTFWS